MARIGTKTRAVRQGGHHRGLVAVAGREGRQRREVAGVGRAVVVLEIVDAGAVAGQAAAGPGLARRVRRAARAGQGRRDVPGQRA